MKSRKSNLHLIRIALAVSFTTAAFADNICYPEWTGTSVSISSTTRPVAGELIAVKGVDGIVRYSFRGIFDNSFNTVFTPLPNQPAEGSAPWIQATVGGMNNIYIVSNGKIYQWIWSQSGIATTNGISDAANVKGSIASAKIDNTGRQAIFAVFNNGSVHYRIWDPTLYSWTSWIDMGLSGASGKLFAVQISSSTVNLYVSMNDGSVKQKWSINGIWSNWVTPLGPGSTNGEVASVISPSSGFQYLFWTTPQGVTKLQYWNGTSWVPGYKNSLFSGTKSLTAYLSSNGHPFVYGIDENKNVWNGLITDALGQFFTNANLATCWDGIIRR